MDRHTGNSGDCNAGRSSVKGSKIRNRPPSVSILTNIYRNTILASIGGKRTQCLIDTGATVSCISNAFISKTNLCDSKLKPSDISEISGVGGERHKILDVLEIPLTISGATFVFNFYVLPALQHSIIIGIDFMETYTVEMDLSKKTVFIHDKLVHTSIVQSDSGLARVPQTTEIPAHSQMNIELKVTRRKSGDQVLLEPTPSLNNRNLAGGKVSGHRAKT